MNIQILATQYKYTTIIQYHRTCSLTHPRLHHCMVARSSLNERLLLATPISPTSATLVLYPEVSSASLSRILANGHYKSKVGVDQKAHVDVSKRGKPPYK